MPGLLLFYILLAAPAERDNPVFPSDSNALAATTQDSRWSAKQEESLRLDKFYVMLVHPDQRHDRDAVEVYTA